MVIECREAQIVLAHMKNGSVAIQEEESVVVGQPLGQVGNSGISTEPHLHIHAVPSSAEDILANSEGIPMLFDGTFPVRNTVFTQGV